MNDLQNIVKTGCAVQQDKQPKRKTALAQLVELYAEKGVTSTTELVDMTGYSRRQIWRAKAEISDARVTPDICDTDARVTPDADDTDARVTTVTPASPDIYPSPPEKRKVSPCTPSKEKTNPPIPQAGNARESFQIEGLNGSTGSMVTQLATAVAGELGNPDFRAAREILAGNVSVFGPDRVRAAFAEWHAKLLDGRAAPSYRAFTGFCKTATTHPPAAQPGGLAALLDKRAAERLAQQTPEGTA